MRRNLTKLGLFAGLTALALSTGKGDNSNAQYNFSKLTIPDVKYVEPNIESKKFEVYLLPTEKNGGVFGLSLAEDYGGRTTLLSRERFGDQMIKDPSVFNWLVGDIISSGQYARERTIWGDILRPNPNDVQWDNRYDFMVTSNSVFTGKYADRISIKRPGGERGIDYFFDKDTGVVTHLVRWKVENGKPIIDGAEDLNPADQFERQTVVSTEKDGILDELHLRG